MPLRYPTTCTRALLLAAWIPLLAGMAACLGPVAATPSPRVAMVPHPSQPPPPGLDWDDEERTQAHTVSPHRNPDGLGTLTLIWPQSQMTLLSWELREALEERRRIAFARDAATHSAAMEQARALHREYWIFAGLLVGDNAKAVQPEFYMPDGIYLLDDQGRRFAPAEVSHDTLMTGERNVSRFGASHASRPVLLFPKTAITPQTRAVSLYLAAGERRARFTWVFDPTYSLPAGGEGGGDGDAPPPPHPLFPRR